MKRLTTTLTFTCLLASAQAGAEGVAAGPDDAQGGLVISRSGTQASFPGPAEYFTGSVQVDMLSQPTVPSGLSSAYVTFEPGARTAWHTYPLGQTLIVTEGEGEGWVQEEGKARQEIRPGDLVWIPAGIRHWHGATGTMTHIALTEALDGKNVDWLEQVSDEQYGR